MRAAGPSRPTAAPPSPAPPPLGVNFFLSMLLLCALGGSVGLGVPFSLPAIARAVMGSNNTAPVAAAAAAAASPPSPAPLPRCCCMGMGATARCWPPPGVAGGRPYTILWHSNQFGPRGTEVSMYDYASSFEEFLCGVSHVMTFGLESLVNRMPFPDSMASKPKFESRFPGRTHLLMRNGNTEVDELIANVSADAFYATQYGTRAGTVVWPTPEKGGRAKTLLHAVFDGNEPHYDSYAVIGETVPRLPGVPVVHYLTYVSPALLDLPGLRGEWGVPPDARVFCRHGGPGTFDIAFVRQAVCDHAASHPKDYFVLLGTDAVGCDLEHKNIINLPKSTDLAYKQQFLNSCNACLHARSDGETFGLGVAECAMSGLPVMTYCSPPGAASFHIQTLGSEGMLYCDAPALLAMLDGFDVSAAKAKREVYMGLYSAFGPGATMLEFMTNFGILEHYMGISNPRNMSHEGRCVPFLALPGSDGS